MEKKQRSLALAGAGIAAAAALGLTGATLAGAAETTTTAPATATESSKGGEAAETPGRGGGMRDAGGSLSADAASKAVAAAQGEVDGTVNGVRALSTGSFVVHVTKSDGTHVHVVLDATFAVTSVEEGGMGRGGRDKPTPDGDDSTGSTEPSATSTSAPTT